MALVSAATGADDLGADHAVAGVADGAEVIFRKRSREARPARAALELRAAPEQRQTAQAAGIHPRSLLFEEDAAERGFGSVLEQHVALLFAEFGNQLPKLIVAGRGQVELNCGHIVHFKSLRVSPAYVRLISVARSLHQHDEQPSL